MAATVEDPELGPTTQVGVPAVLAATPGDDPGRPAPGGRAQPGGPARRGGYSGGDIDALVEAGVVEEGSPWAR